MSIIKIAASQLGVKEITGPEHNSQIVEYAEFTGIDGITNDEIPWCSTFVNWCAKKAGLKYSGKATARSWVHIGTPVDDPIPGDVVVFWRESIHSWKGHVGIFMGFNKQGTKVFCLGGNQNNEVNIREYDVEKVLSYRRIDKREILEAPEAVLQKGNRGPRVVMLQKALNFLGYNCGDVDGDYGRKTESALKFLQANAQIEINGIYNTETKIQLESLLQS
jgi:uncharacterized protein (TIGR02594 family)